MLVSPLIWNISTESTCLDQVCTCNFPNGPIEGCQGSPTLGCCPFGTPHIDHPGSNRRIPDRRIFGIEEIFIAPCHFTWYSSGIFEVENPQGMKMRKFFLNKRPQLCLRPNFDHWLVLWAWVQSSRHSGLRTNFWMETTTVSADLPWHQAAPSILQQLTPGNWKDLKGLRSRNQTSLPSPPAGHQKRHLMILDVQFFGLFGRQGLATDCYQAMSAGAVQFAACLGSDSVGFRTVCTWRAEKHAA